MGMWGSIFVAVVSGLVVVVVAWIFSVSTPRVRDRYSRWRLRRITKAEERNVARKRAERQRERSEGIAAADAEGRRVAVSHTGRRPVEVTFNDGSVAYHFCGDWQAYQAAMRSGRYDLKRTHHTDPPPLI